MCCFTFGHSVHVDRVNRVSQVDEFPLSSASSCTDYLLLLFCS